MQLLTLLRLRAMHGALHSPAGLVEEAFVMPRCSADGRTALMLACAKGFRETVQLLLEAGASVNAKDNFGGTAMWALAHA